MAVRDMSGVRPLTWPFETVVAATAGRRGRAAPRSCRRRLVAGAEQATTEAGSRRGRLRLQAAPARLPIAAGRPGPRAGEAVVERRLGAPAELALGARGVDHAAQH